MAYLALTGIEEGRLNFPQPVKWVGDALSVVMQVIGGGVTTFGRGGSSLR